MNAHDIRRDMIAEFVAECLSRFDVDRSRVTPDAELESLGVDCLDLAEMAQALKREFAFQVRPEDFHGARTVGDVLDVIQRKARLG